MPFTHGHALIIGVGEYQHISQYNVPVAARDAGAVRDVLQNPQLCGYPPGQVTVLTNQDATRANILSRLELAANLGVEDTLFLFFVGHGIHGADGKYYLTCHDTLLEAGKVKSGTGVSEEDLLAGLRKVKTKRLLLVINACHAGQLSPSFEIGNETFSSEPPPQKLAEALLSTGEGRITISACRPKQKSWIGNGTMSIFSGAVVGGLEGQAPNRAGYISAYGLYEHVYFAVKEAAEQLGQEQEPELTVLKGVGPFPVALYRGATDLGSFDASEPAPVETAARQVSPEKSQRMLNQYQAILTHDGAIAQGDHAVAVGKGGVYIGGKVTGSTIITGDNNRVEK